MIACRVMWTKVSISLIIYTDQTLTVCMQVKVIVG